MRAAAPLPAVPRMLTDGRARQARRVPVRRPLGHGYLGLGAEAGAGEQQKAGKATIQATATTTALALQAWPVVGTVIGAVIAALAYIPGVAETIGKAFGAGKAQHAAAQRLGDSSVVYYSLANAFDGLQTGEQLIGLLKSGTMKAARQMPKHRARGVPSTSQPNHGAGWIAGAVGKELHFAIHAMGLQADPRVAILEKWLETQGIPPVQYFYGRAKTSESIDHLDRQQRAGPGTPWHDLVFAVAKPFADAGAQIVEQARREAEAKAKAAAEAEAAAKAAAAPADRKSVV